MSKITFSRVFFAVGGLNTSYRFSFDYDFFFKLAQRRPSGHINDYLAYFRHHSEAKTSTINDVRLADDERLFQKYGRYNKGPWYRALLARFHAADVCIRFQYARALHCLRLRRLAV